MKKIKCQLWIGTKTGAFFSLGTFESIAAAKQYVRDCITCYHKITPLKSNK